MLIELKFFRGKVYKTTVYYKGEMVGFGLL